MNRTVVAVAVVAMVIVSILAAGVIAIIAPEGFLTFTGFIGTAFTVITGFVISFSGLNKLDKKVSVVAEQTNGRLTARDQEIARLKLALIENGHIDIVANVTADTANTITH